MDGSDGAIVYPLLFLFLNRLLLLPFQPALRL